MGQGKARRTGKDHLAQVEVDMEWVRQEAAKAPPFTPRQRVSLGQLLTGEPLAVAA
jgi:hypothetical protein